MTIRRSASRLAAGLLVAGAALALLALPAAAHIEPDPARVKPGATVTAEFTVEHGCAEAPTIKLTFKIPKGATHASPQDKAGWTGTKTKGLIVFEGGPLDAHTPDQFGITFTAPKHKTVLAWKVIQQCEGAVTRWIDTAKDAENPPARIGVGKNAPQPD